MLTDEALARRVQRGDMEGLAQLIERHHSPLLGYLYRMTGAHRPLAEDLTQEAFLRVLHNIQQYRYPRPFKPWLYAIATNLARDHLKSAHTRRTTPLSHDHPTMLTSPEDAALASTEAEQVSRALAALPVHQREVVILRYYQDLSLAEIAAALDIPVGTVKSRLSLGVGRLRAELQVTEDERS